MGLPILNRQRPGFFQPEGEWFNTIIDRVNLLSRLGGTPVTHDDDFTVAETDVFQTLLVGDAEITLPSDDEVDLPVGSVFDFIASNATPCTWAAGIGATVHAKDDAVTLSAQWTAGTAKKIGASEWVVIGDFA